MVAKPHPDRNPQLDPTVSNGKSRFTPHLWTQHDTCLSCPAPAEAHWRYLPPGVFSDMALCPVCGAPQKQFWLTWSEIVERHPAAATRDLQVAS